MPGGFDTLANMADKAVREHLTHTIQFKVGNGPWRTTYAMGSYEDGNIATAHSAAITQDIELSVFKSDLPDKPNATYRFKTPRVQGWLLQPISVQSDESGAQWIFKVKKVVE